MARIVHLYKFGYIPTSVFFEIKHFEVLDGKHCFLPNRGITNIKTIIIFMAQTKFVTQFHDCI